MCVRHNGVSRNPWTMASPSVKSCTVMLWMVLLRLEILGSEETRFADFRLASSVTSSMLWLQVNEFLARGYEVPTFGLLSYAAELRHTFCSALLRPWRSCS